jgi:hypothetical protein
MISLALRLETWSIERKMSRKGTLSYHASPSYGSGIHHTQLAPQRKKSIAS